MDGVPFISLLSIQEFKVRFIILVVLVNVNTFTWCYCPLAVLKVWFVDLSETQRDWTISLIIGRHYLPYSFYWYLHWCKKYYYSLLHESRRFLPTGACQCVLYHIALRVRLKDQRKVSVKILDETVTTMYFVNYQPLNKYPFTVLWQSGKRASSTLAIYWSAIIRRLEEKHLCSCLSCELSLVLSSMLTPILLGKELTNLGWGIFIYFLKQTR